jgi:hypothetical protein
VTSAEVVAGLRSAARRSRDAALFNEAGAARHRPEYETALATRESITGETTQVRVDKMKSGHERALELYEHTFVSEQRAADLRREAALFEAAADLIEGTQK